MQPALSIDDVLIAYSMGLFPMADSADAKTYRWYEATQRGLLPIKKLHIPRRLRRTVLQGPYEIRIDSDFSGVIDGCAASTETRIGSWISPGIRELFVALHQAGHAHSVECWRDGTLCGGLYGLALGGAFCGESMFSRARDASKIALVHLCARLWRGGFALLDTQFINPHLLQFGAFEVSRADYLDRLRKAVKINADFALTAQGPESEAMLVKSYLSFNGNS